MTTKPQPKAPAPFRYVEALFTFHQDADCCDEKTKGDPPMQQLRVKFQDGGGGTFDRMTTTAWAADDEEWNRLRRLCAAVRAAMDEYMKE